VGGTVVANKQPGNTKPRLFRDNTNRSLVNALGFPSKGLETAYNNLNSSTNRVSPTIVSISGLSIEQFEHCYKRIQKVCDGVELNISSPNTAGLRIFQEPSTLTELLGRLNEGRNKRLFVKLPTYGHSTGNTHVPENTVSSSDITTSTPRLSYTSGVTPRCDDSAKEAFIKSVVKRLDKELVKEGLVKEDNQEKE